MGERQRGDRNLGGLGYHTGLYHVASLLRATTEYCHSVVTAISLRGRLINDYAQCSKATRHEPYPALFIVVVVVVVVVVGVPLGTVVVVGCVVVVTGVTVLLGFNTTGAGGC